MKKLRLLVTLLCVVLIFSVIPTQKVSAGDKVNKVVITITEPKVGASPDFKATVSKNASTTITSTTWQGDLTPSNSKFTQGSDYTAVFTIRIKSSVSRTFDGLNKINATVNGKKAKVTSGGDKEIKVEYTWTKVGGEALDTPETELKEKLDKLAANFPASNGTVFSDVINYLQENLPEGSSAYHVGGYTMRKMSACEVNAGWISAKLGVTVNGVSLSEYTFYCKIPALNNSTDTKNLSKDKSDMKKALDEYTCTSKTTGQDILDVMNKAAKYGTKANWGSDYYYEAPSESLGGKISGDIKLTLGSATEIINNVLKSLPVAGDENDAMIDADKGAITNALHALTMTNATDQESLMKTAESSRTNPSILTCTGFQREAATFDADGEIVIEMKLALADKTRSLQISQKIPMLVRDMPTKNISVTKDEWDVLRIVNIERYKNGLNPVSMVEELQATTDIREKELATFYSHTRPNGKQPFTAINRTFKKGRTFGENIAKCQKTPATVMNSWMKSSKHYENIMTSKWVYLGVGRDNSNYWVQMFSSGKAITSVKCSVKNCTFTNIEELQKAYLICTTSDGKKSYMPLEPECMEQNENKYVLRLNSSTSISFTVSE